MSFHRSISSLGPIFNAIVNKGRLLVFLSRVLSSLLGKLFTRSHCIGPLDSLAELYLEAFYGQIISVWGSVELAAQMGLDQFTKSDKSRSYMNEIRRRREFDGQLREAEWTKQVLQDTREGVCRAYTNSERSKTYLIWMHYSADFNWWGVAAKKRRQLGAYGAELFHAFLGREREQWYLFPDSKFESLNRGSQYKDGSKHWKVQTGHGRPSNRELLERDSLYKGM